MKGCCNLYKSFENLPEDKKENILSACMAEFVKHGYKQASTNIMVEKAGISKGILYHYFGNKKNLYLYLVDKSMKYYLSELEELYKLNIPDIFDRLLKFALVKLNLIQKDLMMYEFAARAFVNDTEEVSKEIKSRYEKIYKEHIPRVFKDIDTTKLKKGVDVSKLIETIMFCLEGLNAKHVRLYKENKLSYAEMNCKAIEESMSYLNIIKYGAYKTESEE